MKNQAIALAMAMLGVSVPASAQIYESIFTDTNGIEVHAPSTRLLLNPASPVTLTLIAGLDRYVNVKITSATGTQLLNTATVNATMFDRYLPFSCPLNTFVTDAVRFAPFHHH
ncbi:hypothetical protein [Escherichia coli]|uniref:hypothetical protein n=1 Tax=Escherichia coli TaxID=562 RepID=UPI0032DBDA7F